MSRKKPEIRFNVVFEPAAEIDETVLNLFCRIAFGMNLEQAVKEVRKNAGGKYDEIFKGDESNGNG